MGKVILLLYLIFNLFIISNQESIILTTHNLCPYGSYPEGAEVKRIADRTFTGTAVDLVREVLEIMDIELTLIVVPWERAQQMVISGESDGFFAASQRDERDRFAVMSEIIADQNWNWYLLKNSPWIPDDPSFVTDAKVAGFVGSNMLKWMEDNEYRVIG